MKQNDFYEVDGCTYFIPVKLIEEHKHMMNTLELEVAESGFRTFAPNIYKFPKVDEPQKIAVPQFVADWYEENKDDIEYKLYKLCIDFREQKLRADLHAWFNDDNNKCIETLVKMKLYGYEVEKEQLYTVEIPNPNGHGNRYGLCKVDGRIIIGSFVFGLNKAVNTKLTESEIKQDFDWAFRWAKEVEE